MQPREGLSPRIFLLSFFIGYAARACDCLTPLPSFLLPRCHIRSFNFREEKQNDTRKKRLEPGLRIGKTPRNLRLQARFGRKFLPFSQTLTPSFVTVLLPVNRNFSPSAIRFLVSRGRGALPATRVPPTGVHAPERSSVFSARHSSRRSSRVPRDSRLRPLPLLFIPATQATEGLS